MTKMSTLPVVVVNLIFSKFMEIGTTENRYYEDYLIHTGWGLAYKFIIGISCIGHFTRGVTFVSIAFSVALSSCTSAFMDEINANRIFVAYFVGCGFGGLAGNSLGDRYGRKRYLIYSYLCIFGFTYIASFAFDANVVIVAVFFLGAGLEVNAVQTRVLVVEILSQDKRGFWIAFCELFWSLGYLLTAFLLIFFETSTFLDFGSNSKPVSFWRVMFAISGGISFTIACALNVVEESPRYCISTGRSYLAYLHLKKYYSINLSKFAPDFEIKEDEIENLISDYGLNYREPKYIIQKIKLCFRRLWKSMRLIFTKRFCPLTLSLMLLKIPITVLGLFQLDIALGKHLTFEAEHKYEGLDFIYPLVDYSNTTSFCDNNEENALFNKYFLMLGLANIPGQIWCMFVIDRFGRQFLWFSGLLLASCSFIILPFLTDKVFQIILSCLITASISVVILIITLMNLEMYPTAIRGTSNAVTSVPCYIFAAFFLSFVLIEFKWFAVSTGIFYFCLLSLTCFLPELSGKPMIE